LAALRELIFFERSAWRKNKYFSRAKAQRRKGESKAVLCGLASLRELFFLNIRRGGQFFSFRAKAQKGI
jgi:hypothetical protein